MIRHIMINDNELLKAIKSGLILYGGHRKQKIYGTLKCQSGRRMKRQNRVFFENRKDLVLKVISNDMKKHELDISNVIAEKLHPIEEILSLNVIAINKFL